MEQIINQLQNCTLGNEFSQMYQNLSEASTAVSYMPIKAESKIYLASYICQLYNHIQEVEKQFEQYDSYTWAQERKKICFMQDKVATVVNHVHNSYQPLNAIFSNLEIN